MKYKVMVCEQFEVVEAECENEAEERVNEMITEGKIRLSYISWEDENAQA